MSELLDLLDFTDSGPESVSAASSTERPVIGCAGGSMNPADFEETAADPLVSGGS